MSKEEALLRGTRREFIKKGVASVVGAAPFTGLAATDVSAVPQSPARWDRVADVVIAGAGASGLSAAITARDHGAEVIVIDENHDIGGHAMLSGGRIPLGGGTSMQKKYGITDSADQVYLDHTNYRNPVMRYCDRDLVRAWADENVPTFEFLIENGVKFKDAQPTFVNEGSVPRLFITERFSDSLDETINGSPGSGLVRHLEQSARSKGVEFLLRHKLTRIIRESPSSGRVLGITATFEGRELNLQARKGVILATGGHTTNVDFRRTWDPRLTEEYQVAGVPWSFQNGDSEILAMTLGASLWATANQTVEAGAPISKTKHIGCKYGYVNLKWNPESPMFKLVGASGLTVENFQDVILVNQNGLRFWNEMDESFAFLDACLGAHGNLGKNAKTNGGGPIWAIFDSAAVKRERWNPHPPDVDPSGWFFSADSLEELARRITNPYQLNPMSGKTLQETVAKYNSYVDAGNDAEFEKPAPLYKIETAPFYAAWSTPILHDTLSGLKINRRCQTIDIRGQVIPGLYAAGEVAGGFALHGLPRVMVFGRIAGREAALAQA